MSETVTEEELKEAIEVWAPKFNLIRELWPGASIEESLKLMTVIEQKAEEIKEDKKDSMGFGPYVEENTLRPKPTLTRCKPKKNRRKTENLP